MFIIIYYLYVFYCKILICIPIVCSFPNRSVYFVSYIPNGCLEEIALDFFVAYFNGEQ